MHGKDECCRVCLFHGMSKFPSIFGRQTIWDNNLFAFKGKVVMGQVTSVAFPGNAFDFYAPMAVHSQLTT